jgi:hypothetical protein
MITWFVANALFLNLDKTNIIDSRAKNSAHSTLRIAYKEKYIEETVNTKFIGLQIITTSIGRTILNKLLLS